MHQHPRQQIRGFNTRGVVPASVSGVREVRTRRIRGYDAQGTVLFTVNACTSPNEAARTGLDQRAVRQKLESLGAKLCRVEIDAVAGGHSDYLVRADGTLRNAYLVEGQYVTL